VAEFQKSRDSISGSIIANSGIIMDQIQFELCRPWPHGHTIEIEVVAIFLTKLHSKMATSTLKSHLKNIPSIQIIIRD